MKAQAQGLLFLIAFGIGLLAGNFINGAIIDANTTKETKQLVVKDLQDKAADLAKVEKKLPKNEADALAKVVSLKDQPEETVDVEYVSVNYQPMWILATIISGLLLVGFPLVFRDPVAGKQLKKEEAPVEMAAVE
jgi:hypothetical protein